MSRLISPPVLPAVSARARCAALAALAALATGLIALPDGAMAPTPAAAIGPPQSIGDFVWDDTDGDGVQNAGEPGRFGVDVALLDGDGTVLDTDTTGRGGGYTLRAPSPGTYRVRVTAPTRMAFSPKDVGSDMVDSDVIRVGADTGRTEPFTIAAGGGPIPTIDAGLMPTVSIQGRVFKDQDADGIQEPGDFGIPGVSVTLWNAARTEPIAVATTSNSGTYTLRAPAPGSYRVEVFSPVFPFTHKDAGGDDTLDSDINATGVNRGFTDVLSVTPTTPSITSIDAGVVF